MGSQGKACHGIVLRIQTAFGHEIKKNMKNSLMNPYDKFMLRKRFVIDTVYDKLKTICQIEHTRHCSIENLATNMFAWFIAYNLLLPLFQ